VPLSRTATFELLDGRRGIPNQRLRPREGHHLVGGVPEPRDEIPNAWQLGLARRIRGRVNSDERPCVGHWRTEGATALMSVSVRLEPDVAARLPA
jgi:hypothetical protein